METIALDELEITNRKHLQDWLLSNMTETIKGIAEFKQATIISRLKEMGIDVCLEEEQHRRFKSFVLEIQGDKETLYYNDGTISGLKIVTFETKISTNETWCIVSRN